MRLLVRRQEPWDGGVSTPLSAAIADLLAEVPTGVLDGDPPLIETAYRGTETRGLTLNVRFAIREHLAMPRWMEWMEPDE